MFTQDAEYEVHVSCVSDDEKWSTKLVKRLRQEHIPTRFNDQKLPVNQQLRSWMSGVGPRGQKLIVVCSPASLRDQDLLRLIEAFRLAHQTRLLGERLLIPVTIRGGCFPREWGT